MQTVFSGVQPSGTLTIGNYYGAIQNFVKLQETHQCYFCVVDLHALTVPQDPAKLRDQVKDVASLFLAAGIDPQKSVVFVQSKVSAHTELSWLLECSSYLGELSRMTQFKDKSGKQTSIGTGLLTYPVLMASDILLYDTDLVPVGADQKQHLELSRDLAIRVNNRFGELFRVPEPYIPKTGARIMSLADPTSKMSKSDPNPGAYISLLDEEKVLRKKISRAVTDSDGEIRFDIENKPGVSNLLSILSAASGESVDAICQRFEGQGYGALKKAVGDAVCETLMPLQERYRAIRNSSELDDILEAGAQKAREKASVVLERAQKAFGLR